MSCKTTVIERTMVYVPEIDFPEFPILGEYEKKDGKVTTDENFFRQLLMFRETYKNVIEKYNEKKNKLEENKNEL